jgi:hypothetical protein
LDPPFIKGQPFIVAPEIDQDEIEGGDEVEEKLLDGNPQVPNCGKKDPQVEGIGPELESVMPEKAVQDQPHEGHFKHGQPKGLAGGVVRPVAGGMEEYREEVKDGNHPKQKGGKIRHFPEVEKTEGNDPGKDEDEQPIKPLP